MPRAQSTDFYHVFKFHVIDTTASRFGQVLGGFNTCTMPEMTVEAVEYKEGIWTYRRKFPGDVTVSDITLTRGVAKGQSYFFQWLQDAVLGNTYRIDFTIRHYHRDDVSGKLEYSSTDSSRRIKCFNAFPIRVKVGSDFDSMTSEVSIEELDISIEKFEVENA